MGHPVDMSIQDPKYLSDSNGTILESIMQAMLHEEPACEDNCFEVIPLLKLFGSKCEDYLKMRVDAFCRIKFLKEKLTQISGEQLEKFIICEMRNADKLME